MIEGQKTTGKLNIKSTESREMIVKKQWIKKTIYHVRLHPVDIPCEPY